MTPPNLRSLWIYFAFNHFVMRLFARARRNTGSVITQEGIQCSLIQTKAKVFIDVDLVRVCACTNRQHSQINYDGREVRDLCVRGAHWVRKWAGCMCACCALFVLFTCAVHLINSQIFGRPINSSHNTVQIAFNQGACYVRDEACYYSEQGHYELLISFIRDIMLFHLSHFKTLIIIINRK